MSSTFTSTPVRILLLEDSPTDVKLCQAALAASGLHFEMKVARRAQEFMDLAAKHVFDIVLADFRLPDWTGLEALKWLRRSGIATPLILVTGTLGDDNAVECIKQGATDYVLKDHMDRLPLAIARAIKETELEQQFRQAQKMEAVGQLAGGIAHDFNNLLGVIEGGAQLLLEHVNEPARVERYARQIQAAVSRGALLTRQLLAFGRKQMIQPELLDLNRVVADLGELLPRVLTDNIRFSFVPRDDAGHVRMDRGQLEQIIMNLAVNARDAMPAGGVLEIATSSVLVQEASSLRQPMVAPGNYGVLEVRDTGTGIPPEVMRRMFDAFFTTKEPGKGTGLGLATVDSIVRQSGGFVDVNSTPGEGTTFRVCLPRVEAGVTVELVPEPQDALGGRETILLVEDDEILRSLLVEYLAGKGYRVLEALGSQALELAGKESVDLLVTDISLPEISGTDLAARAKARLPALRVLFMSGYADSTHGIKVGDQDGFIQKPFQLQELARKIRWLLQPANGKKSAKS